MRLVSAMPATRKIRKPSGCSSDERHAALGLDDLDEAQRAGHEHDADEREAERQLVGDHLGGRAQRAEQRVLAVRGPAAEDDPVDRERADRHEHEQPRVDVGDDQPAPERDERVDRRRRHHREQRRRHEEPAVGRGRHDVLLRDQLDGVGDPLEHAEGPGPVRAVADLEAAEHLALGPGRDADDDRQREQHDQDLEERPEQRQRVHRRLPRRRRDAGDLHAGQRPPRGRAAPPRAKPFRASSSGSSGR